MGSFAMQVDSGIGRQSILWVSGSLWVSQCLYIRLDVSHESVLLYLNHLLRYSTDVPGALDISQVPHFHVLEVRKCWFDRKSWDVGSLEAHASVSAIVLHSL